MEIYELWPNFRIGASIGEVYGIGAIGVALIIRFLKFTDLSILGSMSLGTISCIWAFSEYGLVAGLMISFVVGGLMGVQSAVQIKVLGIDPTYAGIIGFSAYQTVAFLITDGKSHIYVDTARRESYLDLLTVGYSAQNIFVILFAALVILSGVFLLFRYFRIGVEAWALTGGEGYVKHRVVSSTGSTFVIMFLAHAIIGFSGGILGLEQGIGSVEPISDFLIVSVGGYAFSRLIVGILDKISSRFFVPEMKPSGNIYWKILGLFTFVIPKNEESPLKFVFYLFITFVGSTFIYCTSVFTVLFFENDSGQIQHLVKAALILLIFVLPKLHEITSRKFHGIQS